MTPAEFEKFAEALAHVPRETRRDEMVMLLLICLATSGFHAGVLKILPAFGIDQSDLTA